MESTQEKLLNPTKGQIIYRNNLGATALENNAKKATGTMRKDGGGRCCLQVYEDVAISCGLDIPRSSAEAFEPPWQVASFFGWPSTNPELVLPFYDLETKKTVKQTSPASRINDGLEQGKNKAWYNKGLPHKKIAECFRNTFCRTNSKWSFRVEVEGGE